MRIERTAEFTYEIAPEPPMRVPGRVYAHASLFEQAGHEEALQQVANVATLPGVVAASIAMPDIHWGYGFPIGGVAAMDEADGVVSPGGVGFDINCGVRLVRTKPRPRGRAAAARAAHAGADAARPTGRGAARRPVAQGGRARAARRRGSRVPRAPRPGHGGRPLAHRGGRCHARGGGRRRQPARARARAHAGRQPWLGQPLSRGAGRGRGRRRAMPRAPSASASARSSS